MIIYKVTNRINNMVYIGMTTKSLEERMRKHYKAQYGSKIYFHRALRKYLKQDFIWEVIDKCTTKNTKDLAEMEVAWIYYYDSYRKGYNSTIGGEGTFGRYGKQTSTKLTKKEVFKIIIIHNKGIALSKIAKRFNVAVCTIFNIIHRKSWADVTKNKKINPVINKWNPKFSNKDAVKIRELYATGMYTHKSIAKIYNTSAPAIGDIVRKVTYKNI